MSRPRTSTPPRPWPLRLKVGLAGLALLGAIGLLAPWLAPYDPVRQFDTLGGQWRPPGTTLWRVELGSGREMLADRLEVQGETLRLWRRERVDPDRVDVLPLVEVRNFDPDTGTVKDKVHFALGSDLLGRDVASRWLFATRVSLAIAFATLLLSSSAGILIGALAAFGGRWLDLVLMRLLDAFLAFPWIILLITLATFYNTGPVALVLVMAATSWMGTGRLARAEIRLVKEKEYVLAARMLGVSRWLIFWRHILPNVSAPLLVDATNKAGQLVLVEAAISFLGLGVLPPQPSWGNMIADARDLATAGWWLMAIPTLSLVLTALSVQWTADALRDVLDPRWRYPADGAAFERPKAAEVAAP